jgi:DNA-binding MarR family transcriptional regulator
LSNRTELIAEVFAAMRRLSTEIDALDQRAADYFGTNRTDLHLIDVLRSRGPLTASQLASAVGLTSGGLSIALDRLERIGYVRRSQHPDDRRSVLVEATDVLVPLEAEMFGSLAERTRKLLGTYNREQLTTIKHYLEHAAEITNTSARPSEPKKKR